MLKLACVIMSFIFLFQQEIHKDEKFVKAKPFIPTQSESFKIYDEDKKEEPSFKIYEDKLEEETLVALRKEKKEAKAVQEQTVKSDREQPRLEIRTVDSTSAYAFCSKIEEVCLNKQNALSKDSPMSIGMSLEKSLTYSSSSNEEYRSRREYNKELRTNFFDVDEYRADIYNYLRLSEVQAYFHSTLIRMN